MLVTNLICNRDDKHLISYLRQLRAQQGSRAFCSSPGKGFNQNSDIFGDGFQGLCIISA